MVEKCGNMHLENLIIIQFVDFLQKAKKMTQSLKPIVEKTKERKVSSPYAMFATPTMGGKRKSPKGRSFKEPLAILCTPRELNVVLANG